ncbi:MAG: hypothetical protein WB510_13920 [Candidatus Sulfotelmatobacter sp.]
MRITLLGALGFVGVAILLFYAGYELHRTIQVKAMQSPQSLDS